MKNVFTLGVATKSASYSHTIQFAPQDDGTVIVRRMMRDEIMGNWSGHHGQPEVMPLEAARNEFRKWKRLGYRQM